MIIAEAKKKKVDIDVDKDIDVDLDLSKDIDISFDKDTSDTDVKIKAFGFTKDAKVNVTYKDVDIDIDKDIDVDIDKDISISKEKWDVDVDVRAKNIVQDSVIKEHHDEDVNDVDNEDLLNNYRKLDMDDFTVENLAIGNSFNGKGNDSQYNVDQSNELHDDDKVVGVKASYKEKAPDFEQNIYQKAGTYTKADADAAAIAVAKGDDGGNGGHGGRPHYYKTKGGDGGDGGDSKTAALAGAAAGAKAIGGDIDQKATIVNIFKGSEGAFGVLVAATLKMFRYMPENRKRFSYFWNLPVFL